MAPDDVVVARAIEASSWARRNSRAIIIALLVLAVAVAAVLYYVSYRRGLQDRAAAELIEIRRVASTGDVTNAVLQLDGFLGRFDGTAASNEARLLLGQLQLAQGNAPQAIDAVEPLTDENDPLLSASASLLLAGAQEAAGQTAQAEQTYLRVAESAEMEFQKREALEDAARIRAASGNAAGAVELYDRLIGMVEEGSPDRDVYQMRRAEIMAAQGQ
ncbi:MAG TPA: tetratricopeptide repeat protein [Longimicrobiales bacterium]